MAKIICAECQKKFSHSGRGNPLYCTKCREKAYRPLNRKEVAELKIKLSDAQAEAKREERKDIREKKMLQLTRRQLIGLIRFERSNHQRPDLSFTNLGGVNLSRIDLSRVILKRANLCNANLKRVDFSEANLIEANLTGANQEGINWKDATYNGARGIQHLKETPEGSIGYDPPRRREILYPPGGQPGHRKRGYRG